jgi:hypothetical protein
MIFTNTGLTNYNIIFDFDISNTKSYDSNTGFTLTSLTFWEDYILSDLTLTGYGQTMYDFGLATSTSFTESKSYKIKDRNLILNRIGYNNPIGQTTFPQITSTSSTEGNSFILNGGYLTSFFKLHDETFQLAKYRNENGFTIDTWVHIDQNTFDKITSYTEGFFVYLGTKAENKFNIFYSASTDNLGIGFTYDNYNYLNDIEFNAVGFKFNNDKTISLRYLEVSGLATEYKSINTLTTTGWTNIGFTFRYCDKIRDNYADSKGNSLLDCVPLRKGNFKIFVNGKIFHEEDNIDEFLWLKPLNTDGDRQVGLPYTINWGGGSWGLKHSFIPSVTSYTAYSSVTTGTTYILTSGATNILVDGNYGTFEGASGTTSGNTSGITTDVYSSILTATTALTYTGTNSLLLYASPSAISNLILTGFTYTGTTNIIIGGNSGTFEGTVVGITSDTIGALIITSTTRVFSGTNSLYLSAATYASLTDNLLYFTTPISLEANKKYLYEGKFYDNNTFPTTSDTKGVYLQFLSEDLSDTLDAENIIFSSITYTSNTAINQWVDLKFHFQTPLIITGGSQYLPAVKIIPSAITGSCNFYFDNFKVIKQDYVETSSAATEITGYTYTPLSNIITNGDSGTFQSNINGMSTPLTNGQLIQVVSTSNYLGLKNNGGSVGGFSDVNGYSFVRFNTALNLSANTKYVYSGTVWDYNRTYTTNQNIFLGFLDGFETGCTTVSSITFDSGSTGNNFYNLRYEFITPTSVTSNKTLTIKTNNTTLFNTDFFLLFDNFRLIPHTTNPQTAFTTSFTFSTLTNNLVVFNTPINVLPNKTYIYQGKFYDDNSYLSGSSKGVYLTFSGGLDSEITIVTSVTYTSETSATTWNDLKLVFITPSGLTGTTSYTPIIKVDYTTGITAGYKFYFDEFSIAEYDLTNLTGLTGYSVTEEILLNKNVNSIIKDNFDGSFYGKIQKLRMYDIDLNFSEIKKNYNYHSTKYGFTKLK